MLNKEEENTVQRYSETTPTDEWSYTDILWLAEKLKETNEELKIANIYSSTVAKEFEELRKINTLLKEGCSHQGNSHQEIDGEWLTEVCSICGVILSSGLK
jgi:hypothetical protein